MSIRTINQTYSRSSIGIESSAIQSCHINLFKSFYQNSRLNVKVFDFYIMQVIIIQSLIDNTNTFFVKSMNFFPLSTFINFSLIILMNNQLIEEEKVTNQKLNSVRIEVKKLEAKLSEVNEIAKKTGNLAYLRQNKQIIFQNYLSILDVSDFKTVLPKQSNARHYMVIGDISAGKSSFINYFFEKNEDVGVGQTTPGIKQIEGYRIPHTNKKIYIWDTPGKNEQFNVSNFEYLGLFKSADKIFILNKKGIKDVSEMIQVLYKVAKDKLYYVRTQVDSDLNMTEQKLKDLRNKDKNEIYNLGIFSIKMFQIAVNNRDNKIKLSQYDNQAVYDELHEWKEEKP